MRVGTCEKMCGAERGARPRAAAACLLLLALCWCGAPGAAGQGRVPADEAEFAPSRR
jgi:hypothetical protein